MTARRLGDAVRLGDYDPGTEQWHDLRAFRVGGSEIAPLLGVSEYTSAFALWHIKRHQLPREQEQDQMRFGKLIEPVIVELYRADHPGFAFRRPGTYVNRERDYQLATPDGITRGPDGPELVELKTDGDGWKWGEPGTDDIPPGYLAQCRWQLDTFGYRRCRMLVLIGGRPPVREYVIEPDDDDTALMRAAAAEFVRTLRADEVPTIDGHSATWQAIKDMHPDIDGTDLEVPDEVAWEYRSAVAEAKRADEEKRRMSGELVSMMGTARRAVIPSGDPKKPDVVARREPYRDATRLVPVNTKPPKPPKNGATPA